MTWCGYRNGGILPPFLSRSRASSSSSVSLAALLFHCSRPVPSSSVSLDCLPLQLVVVFSPLLGMWISLIKINMKWQNTYAYLFQSWLAFVFVWLNYYSSEHPLVLSMHYWLWQTILVWVTKHLASGSSSLPGVPVFVLTLHIHMGREGGDKAVSVTLCMQEVLSSIPANTGQRSSLVGWTCICDGQVLGVSFLVLLSCSGLSWWFFAVSLVSRLEEVTLDMNHPLSRFQESGQILEFTDCPSMGMSNGVPRTRLGLVTPLPQYHVSTTPASISCEH